MRIILVLALVATILAAGCASAPDAPVDKKPGGSDELSTDIIVDNETNETRSGSRMGSDP